MSNMNEHLAGAMRQNFMLFLMRVYGDLHPGKAPLDESWYLRALCHAMVEAASRSGARLVINVPPRHLKSVAASVALTAYLLGRDPALKIMVATYSQDLARLHAGHCRTIMQAGWYQNLFPNTRVADNGKRLLEIVTTRGGGRKAVSVGGTVTGHGADIIIVDDCLKAEDARSEAKREEANAWFNGTLTTRLNTPGGGTIISISQRLHEDDLPARLLAKGYDHLCLPAIAERDEKIAIGAGRFHHRKVGDLLNRAGQTREGLEAERRNIGPREFSAQFQQNPVAPEGNLIRLEWFGSYDELLERHEYCSIIQSWDTALSDEPTADCSVCTTWGFFDRRWHLLDVLRERLAFPDLRRAVLRQHRLWNPEVVLIEDAGTGTALWQEFRSSRELRPVMCSATRDKETRLIGVTGQLEAGVCVLPAEAPWLEQFQRELRAFPYGRHDDQVDSMTQFLEYYLLRGEWLKLARDSRGRPVRAPRRGLGRRPD
jgi:predicted phage terminase large subunit-like protein